MFVIFHNYPNVKSYLHDSLTLKKTLTLYNLFIHIKSVLNIDQNHYYYKIVLENCLYQLAKTP